MSSVKDDVNIEIIAACNNTCEFCYQKDFHNTGKILSLKEIKEIIDWIVPDTFIEISGGEPTMHPDIIDIMKYSIEKNYTVLFTNLLCETSIVEKLSELLYFRWVINTNSREELKSLFYENLDFLNNKLNYLYSKKQGFTFLVPITGNVEKDKNYIKKLENVLNRYQKMTKEVQIEFCHDLKNRNLPINYSESINLLFDTLEKDNKNIEIKIKCAVDFCSLDVDTVARILKNNHCIFLPRCSGRKAYITVDKEAKYCRLAQNGFLMANMYNVFPNSLECISWLSKQCKAYMEINERSCHVKNPDCHNNICFGVCPVINEAMRIQNNMPINRLI